ncbi:MAG: phasin family protein [Thermoanaerobaculia bacterium]|jgi:poly(hydroxyalkanoate) granule-associated protein
MNTEQVTTGYKKLQDELFESTRRIWLAGLGTLSVVEEESTEIFDQLIKKGRLVEEKSRQRMSKTKAEIESGTEELSEELAEKLDRQVSGVLQKLGVPSRAQVQDLTQRVEQLSEQVDRLAPAQPVKKSSTGAGTTKTTKTTAKTKQATAKTKQTAATTKQTAAKAKPTAAKTTKTAA